MIREAEPKDVSALSHLYHQLVRSVAPDTMIDVREDRIEQIRTDPHNFLFVLEMKDRICGSAFLTLCLDPLYRYQPYALLENFVIDQGQQGKGYGTILARYMEDFCLQADEILSKVVYGKQAHPRLITVKHLVLAVPL